MEPLLPKDGELVHRNWDIFSLVNGKHQSGASEAIDGERWFGEWIVTKIVRRDIWYILNWRNQRWGQVWSCDLYYDAASRDIQGRFPMSGAGWGQEYELWIMHVMEIKTYKHPQSHCWDDASLFYFTGVPGAYHLLVRILTFFSPVCVWKNEKLWSDPLLRFRFHDPRESLLKVAPYGTRCTE
jgi:hypothetical protein